MRVSIILVAIALSVADARAQVAISEFLNNPDGADQGREWLELYNFGPNDLCLAGWTVEDEDTDSFTLPEVSIDSGGYLILVSGGVPGLGGVDAATAKAIFQTEWLGGRQSPLVIGMQDMALGNEGDEIVLRDPARSIIWSLAWSDDETPPFATFLTETNQYTVRVFGSHKQPGIQEIKDRTIVAEHVFKESHRLFVHLAAPLRELRIELFILVIVFVEIADVQPLAGELNGQTPRAFVTQHPPGLCHHGFFIGELTVRRHATQFRIRQRGPKEITQPVGQFQI